MAIKRITVNHLHLSDFIERNPNSKLPTNNRSGYRGVSVHPGISVGNWHTRITVNKRTILLGDYARLEQARAAAKAAERLYFTLGMLWLWI